MKGAILEVLLVCAEGIGHTRVLGHPGYHVIVECGAQMCRSKTSSGLPASGKTFFTNSAKRSLDKIYWNEKIIFEFPSPELESLNHLKFKIVNEKYFTEGKFVGETLIFIKGIIVEGNRIGLIELHPTPFNVVLQDSTYKGQITIGLKFIPETALHLTRKENVHETNDVGETVCTMVTNLWKLQWWKLLFTFKNRNMVNKPKDN